MRFDHDAKDRAGAEGYLAERASQALIDGFVPTSFESEPLVDDGVEWGLRAHLRSPEGVSHQTVYVYEAHRGRGRLSRCLLGTSEPVVTVPDCNIEQWLTKKGVPYRVIARESDADEYKAIGAHYGGARAKRSGVMLMHHVDEGLAVLRRIGASDRAKRAFCLHPLVQSDADLAANYPRVGELTRDPQVLALALEYRNVANATLSHREIRSPAEIPLSPLGEVNEMLVADKVQNYKDFLLHHGRTHPRRAELDVYFRRWLVRLGVSEAALAEHFVAVQATPNPLSLGAMREAAAIDALPVAT